MNQVNWSQIKDVFSTALSLSPGARGEFLSRLDPEIRTEVVSLLAAHESNGDAFEQPLITTRAELLGKALDASLQASFGPEQIGQYRIVSEIGRGGMATVFRAVRVDDSGKQYALKIIRPELNQQLLVRRFQQELHILKQLEHPYIAVVLDSGITESGEPFFVMDVIEGLPVDEYCDRNVLSIKERLALFLKVCEAVQVAHAMGVVHRDLKPSNVLVDANGTPKLLDFGIAKVLNPDLVLETVSMTATMQRLLTPEYASPEQVRGELVTPASDVYSLGVLLYELLTGERPYSVTRNAPEAMVRAICQQQPAKPSSRFAGFTRTRHPSSTDVSAEVISANRSTTPKLLRRRLKGKLDNIVLKALAKNAEDRYQSAGQFADDITRYLQQRPITARGEPLTKRAKNLISARSLLAVASAIALLAVLSAILLWRGHAPESLDFGNARLTPVIGSRDPELQPALSPDGRRVAFVWQRDPGQKAQIYLSSLDGQNLRQITSGTDDYYTPAWSRDGSQLAFVAEGSSGVSLWTLPLSNPTKARRICSLRARGNLELSRPLEWHPNGRAVLVSDLIDPETLKVFEVDLETGNRRGLTVPPLHSLGDANPRVSPDGRSLAFIRMMNKGLSAAYVQPLAGGEPRQIKFNSRWPSGLAWTPDSRSLILSCSGGGQSGVWLLPLGRRKAQRLPIGGSGIIDPSISQDGSKIVYSARNFDANIWRLRLSGSETASDPRPIINSPAIESEPSVSPNSKRIVYSSSETGSDQLWISDIDGQNSRQLTHISDAYVDTPTWSTDGRSVLFISSSRSPFQLFVISAEGGTPKRLTNSTTATEIGGSWSRDSRWIYFTSNQSGRFEVWRTSEPGGVAEQVTRAGGRRGIESPDGKYLYYAKRNADPGIYRIPTHGGLEERVMLIKPGDWCNWVPGRQGVYFASGDKDANLYFYDLNSQKRTMLHKLGYVPADESAVALSPDEKYFFYTRIDQMQRRIMLLDKYSSQAN